MNYKQIKLKKFTDEIMLFLHPLNPRLYEMAFHSLMFSPDLLPRGYMNRSDSDKLRSPGTAALRVASS